MTAPDPMTPADCDLRGMEWLPLYGGRLFGSDFDSHATDAEFRAGMQLWWAAWNQIPAASLPEDDLTLCRLAGFGRDVKAWRKVRDRALHGFVLCSDGRLYHRALSLFAIESWGRRLGDRARKARWREQQRDADSAGDGTSPGRGRRRGQNGPVPVSETADETRRDETRPLKSESAPTGRSLEDQTSPPSSAHGAAEGRPAHDTASILKGLVASKRIVQ